MRKLICLLMLVGMLAFGSTAIAIHPSNMPKILSLNYYIVGTDVKLFKNEVQNIPILWHRMDLNFFKKHKKVIKKGDVIVVATVKNVPYIYLHYKGVINPTIWSYRPHGRYNSSNFKWVKSNRLGTGHPYERSMKSLEAYRSGKTKPTNYFWLIPKAVADNVSEYSVLCYRTTDNTKGTNGVYYGAHLQTSKTFTIKTDTALIKDKIKTARSIDKIKITLEEYSIKQEPKTNDPKLSMSHIIKISILFNKDVGLGEKSALFYIEVHPWAWAIDRQADWKGKIEIEIPFGKKATLTFNVPPGYSSKPFREIDIQVRRDYKYKGLSLNGLAGEVNFKPEVTITPTVVIE